MLSEDDREQEYFEDDEDVIFGRLHLWLKHPDEPIAPLAEKFGLSSEMSWEKGKPHPNPRLKHLKPRRDYYWAHSREVEVRLFNAAVFDIIKLLKPHAEELRRFRASGGRILLFPHLNGEENGSLMLEPEFLADLAALGVSLGFEVIPDFN